MVATPNDAVAPSYNLASKVSTALSFSAFDSGSIPLKFSLFLDWVSSESSELSESSDSSKKIFSLPVSEKAQSLFESSFPSR